MIYIKDMDKFSWNNMGVQMRGVKKKWTVFGVIVFIAWGGC